MKKNLHLQSPLQTSIDSIWNQQNINLIDVRSPGEFQDGTIPGAINIPLLDDLERSLVGTLYKQYGQDKAVNKGYELLEPKVTAFLDFFARLPGDRKIAVFCARGGMRSQVIVSFLNSNGYKAEQVSGGYKLFRKWNLEKLEQFTLQYPIILHGRTGVGKTLVLEQLENALDLEGLARHRGSMFGAVGKNPVSQKTFEAELLKKLQSLDNTIPVYIEGESRKIGNVTLPGNLFKQMKSAIAVLLDSSIETRARRTVEEYIDKQPDAKGDIRDIILKLEKDLGKKGVQKLLLEFDKGAYQACFQDILLSYYDKKYGFSMKELTYELTVSSEDIKKAAKEINAHFEASKHQRLSRHD